MRPRVGLASALREATRALTAAGVASARADAVALAGHLLGLPPGEVERSAILGAPAPEGFEGLVAQRCRRIPLQHLTGRATFRRLELEVGPGVFIPRPETELLVDVVLDELAALGTSSAARVVDLCTGSGALALAVADESSGCQVRAVELSREAFAYAERNRDRLGHDVDLTCQDAASALPDWDGLVDVVVSNPPYIPDDGLPMEVEVRDHDPVEALFGGGEDGLAVPARVAARAAGLLRPGGLFVMEHADSQGGDVLALLRAGGVWDDVADHLDLARRPRYVTARRARGP